MKTQDLTQNSDLLGHPPCHQSYHPPLVTQPRAPAPQTLHLIPETRFLLFRFATHCSFLTLHLANSCLSFRTCGLSVTICKSFSSPARVSYSLKLSWQSTIVLSLFLHVHSAHQGGNCSRTNLPSPWFLQGQYGAHSRYLIHTGRLTACVIGTKLQNILYSTMAYLYIPIIYFFLSLRRKEQFEGNEVGCKNVNHCCQIDDVGKIPYIPGNSSCESGFFCSI